MFDVLHAVQVARGNFKASLQSGLVWSADQVSINLILNTSKQRKFSY